MSSCCSSAEATRSRRAGEDARRPAPPIALPPEKATRSAPMARSVSGSPWAAVARPHRRSAGCRQRDRPRARWAGRGGSCVGRERHGATEGDRPPRSPRLPARARRHRCRGRCGRCRSGARRTPPAHGRSRSDGCADQVSRGKCRRAAAPPSWPRPSVRSTPPPPGVSAAAAPVVTSPPRRPSLRRCGRWRLLQFADIDRGAL